LFLFVTCQLISIIIILYYARWQHKQKTQQYKIKNIEKYKIKIKRKRKTIKSKSEYASKASQNGPLNIYVAGLPRKNMID